MPDTRTIGVENGSLAALDLPVAVYGTAKTARIAGRVVAALSQFLKD